MGGPQILNSFEQIPCVLCATQKLREKACMNSYQGVCDYTIGGERPMAGGAGIPMMGPGLYPGSGDTQPLGL